MFRGKFFHNLKVINQLKKQCEEEKVKRIKLESVILTNKEVEYVKFLIQSDQIINSHEHDYSGLYNKFNEELNDVTYNILDKLSKMKGV